MFKKGDRVKMSDEFSYGSYNAQFVEEVVQTKAVGTVIENDGNIFALRGIAVWVEWPVSGYWNICNIQREHLVLVVSPCPMEVLR